MYLPIFRRPPNQRAGPSSAPSRDFPPHEGFHYLDALVSVSEFVNQFLGTLISTNNHS
jgi:hypothetical protein